MPSSSEKIETDPTNITGNEDGEPRSTSMTLLQGLRSKNPESWHRLIELYGPMVCGWCKRQGLQNADVEDVLQEVFRTVLLRIPSFQRRASDGTFRGWLWAITRNKLGDLFRRLSSRPQASGGSEAKQQLEQFPELPDNPDALDKEGTEVQSLYQRALNLISGEFELTTWQAFWQVVCEEKVPADVANNLGISINAVYLAKSRVLRRLRETLGDDEDYFYQNGRNGSQTRD